MSLFLHVAQCLVIQSFQRPLVLFKQEPTTSLSLAGDHQIDPQQQGDHHVSSAPYQMTVIVAHLFIRIKDRRLVHFHKVCPCLQLLILDLSVKIDVVCFD